MALFCGVRILAQLNSEILSEKSGEIIYTLLIQCGLLFILPFVLYCLFIKVKPKTVLEHCNFNKVNALVVLISIALGILCYIITIAVDSLFSGMIAFTGYRSASGGGDADWSTGNFFLQLFLTALLPAICEEFMHRGIVLQGIKHMGFKKAILISSILFALLHLNIQQVSFAFVVGLILGLVAVVSKNIYPAIIIHFVHNGISTYLSFAYNRGWFLGGALRDFNSWLLETKPIIVFIASSFVLILVVVLLCLFIWLLYRQSIIRSVNKAINRAYSNFSVFTKNRPIHLSDEQEVIFDILENNTLLNLDYKAMDNPIDLVMPKEKSLYKPKPMDKLFLWGAIVLGAVITVFTYTWGLF